MEPMLIVAPYSLRKFFASLHGQEELNLIVLSSVSYEMVKCFMGVEAEADCPYSRI